MEAAKNLSKKVASLLQDIQWVCIYIYIFGHKTFKTYSWWLRCGKATSQRDFSTIFFERCQSDRANRCALKHTHAMQTRPHVFKWTATQQIRYGALTIRTFKFQGLHLIIWIIWGCRILSLIATSKVPAFQKSSSPEAVLRCTSGGSKIPGVISVGGCD